MKRKVKDTSFSTAKQNVAYIIACLLSASLFIYVFISNTGSFNLGIGAVFGLVLILVSIGLCFTKLNTRYLVEINSIIILLSICSGLYFITAPILFSLNSKGALIVYLVSVVVALLIRLTNRTKTIERIRNNNLFQYKIDVLVTTFAFLLYFIYARITGELAGKTLAQQKLIKNIIIMEVLLNLCVFCYSAFVAIYYRHKYDIKFSTKVVKR
jgi:hypothetical protein